jgi:gamma-glutamyltranspeptidase/glutathione hydrolase
VTVDSAGNVATVVHTINALAWGSGLFVGGVSIPNSAALQQDLVHSTGPGGRLPDPLNPIIVFKDRKPVLASCTAGTFIHAATLQSLLNVLDFGMDPKAAADAPQIWQPDIAGGDFVQQLPVDGFPEEIVKQLGAMGVAVSALQASDHYGRRGYWVGVKIDPASGRTLASGDPRFNGYAVGY